MRPQFSAAERFETLKKSVRGSWFKMAKLKKLLDKEIADANGKAARLRVEGNTYSAEAEYYHDALVAFERALKEDEPLPASCQEEFQKQMKVTCDNQHDSLQTLIANSRRNWVRDRNNGNRYSQAASEWETFAKNLLVEYGKLDEEIMSYA